jgi:hypothetical protein
MSAASWFVVTVVVLAIGLLTWADSSVKVKTGEASGPPVYYRGRPGDTVARPRLAHADGVAQRPARPRPATTRQKRDRRAPVSKATARR